MIDLMLGLLLVGLACLGAWWLHRREGRGRG